MAGRPFAHDTADVIEARDHLGDVALGGLADGIRVDVKGGVAIEVDQGEPAGPFEDLADVEVAVDRPQLDRSHRGNAIERGPHRRFDRSQNGSRA